MERTNTEVAQEQEIISEATEAQFCELSDLQLTYVGGGIVDSPPV